MKILWVLYNTVGSSGIFVGSGKTQGGGWVDATMEELLKEPGVDLTIAAISNFDKKTQSPSGITYYGVSSTQRRIGKRKIESNVWQKLILEVDPDIIHVWGTEYKNGLDVAIAAKNCKKPILFYIQGVVQAIAQHPNGDIRGREYNKYLGLLGKIKKKRDKKLQKCFEKQALIEAEMVLNADGIIVDNEWCVQYFPKAKVYKHALPLNPVFSQNQQDYELTEGNSIMCCAGRGAHKGLHVLIKALPLIKKDYPNVKVYIPGNMESRKPRWLFEPAYITYVNKLIDKLGVRENIVFCGQLSATEMMERMLKSQIFVLPSCVENHSSTLREAMLLGVPCITSMVGSVQEFVRHKDNGLIFRYGEHEQLAGQIRYLLENKEERICIGVNARESIKKQFPQSQEGVIYNIYQQAINNKEQKC